MTAVHFTCSQCGHEMTVRGATVVPPASPEERAAELAELVFRTVTEHEPIYGREVRRRLRRRRADVRQALLALEDHGRIRRDDAGRWTA